MIKYKKYIKKGGENVRTRIREKIDRVTIFTRV